MEGDGGAVATKSGCLEQSIYRLYIPAGIRFLEEGAVAQRQATAEGSRKSLVNLRVSAHDRDLIDRAAAALGKNRSGFMPGQDH